MNAPQTLDAKTGALQAESVLLAAILTVVAIAAGWASFTHVHDWTMRHTPTGTPDTFGWVNAVISELVPVAAFLTIRRRRRNHQPIGYPVALLIAAATLSLAAQLAVAQPSPSGWLLSAVPALAFMAMVKLVFTTSPPAPPPTPTTAAAPMSNVDVRTAEPDDVPPPVVANPMSPAVAAPVRLNAVPVIGQVSR